MYIAASPEAAQAVEKANKTIVSGSLVAPILEKVFLLDRHSMAILNRNRDGLEPGNGLLPGVQKAVASVLLSGPGLAEINCAIQKAILPRVNGLVEGRMTRTVFLWSWIRHESSLASVEAIWGPEHPFLKNALLEDDFWTFEAHLVQLMTYPMPSLTVRPAFEARKRLLNSMRTYNAARGEERASELIRTRNRVCRSYGLGEEGIVRTEPPIPPRIHAVLTDSWKDPWRVDYDVWSSNQYCSHGILDGKLYLRVTHPSILRSR